MYQWEKMQKISLHGGIYMNQAEQGKYKSGVWTVQITIIDDRSQITLILYYGNTLPLA
jgi:hypothetical protein